MFAIDVFIDFVIDVFIDFAIDVLQLPKGKVVAQSENLQHRIESLG